MKERETFSLSRSLEFMSEAELTKQIGYPRNLWLPAITKELIDNALDHCEEIRRLPEVAVRVADGTLSVRDNGDGIPPETVEAMLDFDRRVSSREARRGPARGAQGNAGKTIVSVPYALNGSHGQTIIEARGRRHEVTVALDSLAQKPKIDHEQRSGGVQNGTFVEVGIADLPSILDGEQIARFVLLCRNFAALNPHLALSLELPGGESHRWDRTSNKIAKWTPAHPEPPGWHDRESFQRLAGACIAKDREQGVDRSLRTFLSQFAGLKRSATLKAVCEQVGIERAPLSALMNCEGLDAKKVAALLASAQWHGSMPKPQKLGSLGRRHIEHVLRQVGSRKPKYKKVVGTSRELPFVVEAAFVEADDLGAEREVITGLNFSPSIERPVLRDLDWMLERQMIDESAPVTVLVHITTVAPTYLDRGKSVVEVDGDLEDAVEKCITSVTANYCRQRKAEERDAARQLRRLDKQSRSRPDCDLKEAIPRVLGDAIRKASGDGACEFSNRDLYYAIRELVQKFTDAPLTQKWCDTVLNEWEVKNGLIPGRLRDPRGFLLEPHTGKQIPLGTKSVDTYEIPAHLYDTIIYVEKKGLLSKFKLGQIGERYDAAIICAEGYAVRASKALIHAAEQGHRIKVLCFHDADPDGYNIARTLSASTGAHSFQIEIIDAGLHLDEAVEMGLSVETFVRKKQLPRDLELSTELEREYFSGEPTQVTGKNGKPTTHWVNCRRVELNALSADPEAFIKWVEQKLSEHGVAQKLVPPNKVITATAKERREVLLRESIQQRLMESLDVEARVDSLTKKFTRRLSVKDVPAAVEAWAEKIEAAPWTKCVDSEIRASIRRLNKDIEHAVDNL